MKVFKVKHVPTGLYLSPTKSLKDNSSGRYRKTNLSKTGKIYHDRPTKKAVVSWYGKYLRLHTSDRSLPFTENDITIEEY